MQSAYERMPRVPGMQHNLLRDYPRTEPVSARYTDTVEAHAPISPFPAETPVGMAYVPYQQWEEPYDTETAFPIGTIFPALDDPFRGGGPCA